jgi:hypothetical protein
MRIAGIALVLFSLAGVHGAELLNSDFADLKSRFVGTWSFTENAQSYEASLKPSLTAMLSWKAIRGLSPFIIPMGFIPC